MINQIKTIIIFKTIIYKNNIKQQIFKIRDLFEKICFSLISLIHPSITLLVQLLTDNRD